MIRLGILGYGNLGRGVENAMKLNDDMELCAIFTRRNPQDVKVNSNTLVVSVSDIEQWKDKIDVLIKIILNGNKARISYGLEVDNMMGESDDMKWLMSFNIIR